MHQCVPSCQSSTWLSLTFRTCRVDALTVSSSADVSYKKERQAVRKREKKRKANINVWSKWKWEEFNVPVCAWRGWKLEWGGGLRWLQQRIWSLSSTQWERDLWKTERQSRQTVYSRGNDTFNQVSVFKWPQVHNHVIFPALLWLPVLTDLQSYHSRRQRRRVPPQITPPLSRVLRSHSRDDEVTGQKIGFRQGWCNRGDPFHRDASFQRTAGGAGQVQVVAWN